MRCFLFLLFCSLIVPAWGQRDTLADVTRSFRYPYPIHYFSLEVGCEDVRMAYIDVKPSAASNGKTVMLFHGKNFGGYYWKDVITGLRQSGYRVVVPDQVGFAKSTKPIISYSFHLLAAHNKALIDSLQIEKVILIGHSMGGMLATRFALLFPQRVEKLILENPIGLEDYRTFVPYTPLEELYQQELKTTSQSIRRYYRDSYFNDWRPEYDDLVTMAAHFLNSSEFPRAARVSALTYQMIYEQPVVYELSNLKVPVVLMIGVRDRTIVGKNKLSREQQRQFGRYDQLSEKAAGKIPDANLITFSAGHIPHVEQPEQFMQRLMTVLP